MHQHQERLGPGLSIDVLHTSARGELRPLAGEKETSSGLGNKVPRFSGDNAASMSESLSVNIMERVLLTTWEASLNRSI